MNAQPVCQQFGQIFAITFVLLPAILLVTEFRFSHHNERLFDDRRHNVRAIFFHIVRWICGHVFCCDRHKFGFVRPFGHFNKTLIQTHFNHIQRIVLPSAVIIEPNIARQSFDFNLKLFAQKKKKRYSFRSINPKKLTSFVHEIKMLRRELNEW